MIAFYLTRIKKFYENYDIQVKDIVISIPSYCSNVERQSILDAAEIANLKCLRVINESTAIALQYGFFRKKDLDAKEERRVAFVDVGHSKTTITIASFVQGKTKIIIHKSDRNLGARDFDWAILQQIGGEFNEKYGADPRKNQRCIVRMLEAVEKARKMLSSVPDANINIDYLLEEEDLTKLITRDEFEKLIDPQVRTFTDLLKQTITDSGLSTEQIHSVEMIGDATRTPIILDITKQCFNKTELFRTLNSLETVAKGSALQAAMLSPLFSVSSFVVEEYNALPCSITYRFADTGAAVVKEIFSRGSMFPLTKTVTFDNKTGDMDLLVHYSDNAKILEGLPTQVARYMVKAGKQKHADNKLGGSKVKFQFKVCNNIHQIPVLEACELIEEWTEEVKIPVKAPTPAAAPAGEKKDGEEAKDEKKDLPPMPQQYETQQRKKTRTDPISFDTQAHALPPDTRKQFKGLEDQLYIDDRKYLDLKESKNKLETLCYNYRDNLNEYGSYEKYMEAGAKAAFLQTIGETVEWLYGEGENSTLEEYNKRVIAFQATGEPVKKRYIFYTTIDDCYKRFEELTVFCNQQLAEIAHLTDEQRNSVIGKIQVARDYMNTLKSEIDAKPKTADPTTTIAEVDNKINMLQAEAKAIFATPVPKPPAEEKPAEKSDAKAEEPAKDASAEPEKPAADADMN